MLEDQGPDAGTVFRPVDLAVVVSPGSRDVVIHRDAPAIQRGVKLHLCVVVAPVKKIVPDPENRLRYVCRVKNGRLFAKRPLDPVAQALFLLRVAELVMVPEPDLCIPFRLDDLFQVGLDPFRFFEVAGVVQVDPCAVIKVDTGFFQVFLDNACRDDEQKQ